VEHGEGLKKCWENAGKMLGTCWENAGKKEDNRMENSYRLRLLIPKKASETRLF